MTRITLDYTKSVEENAGIYFEKAKKLKKKIAGAQDALVKIRKKLENIEETVITRPVIQRSHKKEWYEKFRWFISSEGFLVVGGRDATTNEIIIKKHAEKDDTVMHTDMAGSPFFVIKADSNKDKDKDKDPGEATMNETADATCSFSRAWKASMTSSTVFYVKPEQVTKEANSGEFLPKGAFMIKGKTNYIDNKMNVAIGMYEDKVMAGPIEAISKHCEPFAQIVQGDDKASDCAKKIRHIIGGNLDEIIRALPSGGCAIKKDRKKK